jgi:hypothetical protein
MHGKKERLPFVLKIWHSHALLILKIQCTNSGGAFYFDELTSFYIKNEILFVLSSITKKGEIVSASRLLMDFGN